MPREYLSRDALDHEMLYVLMQHVGEEHGILRSRLVERIFDVVVRFVRDPDTDASDRSVRHSIERLRHQGHMICNMGNGEGYYLAATVEEYQRFRAMYGAHAVPILEAIREMDKTAAERWPNPLQPRML